MAKRQRQTQGYYKVKVIVAGTLVKSVTKHALDEFEAREVAYLDMLPELPWLKRSHMVANIMHS